MWDLSIEAGGSTQCDGSWGSAGWVHESIHKIYRVRAGRCSYALPGGTTTLLPGQIYLIPGDRPHRFGSARNMEVDWLHLRSICPVIGRGLASARLPISWDMAEWTWWDEVWASIPSFMAARTMAGEMRIQALIAALISTELEKLQKHAGASAQLVEAVRWMDRHCTHNPGLAEMAKVAGLSPTVFHKRFAQEFGCSPRKWIERRRMDLARRLLQDGATVQSVADQCGYANPYHFSRVVKRVINKTPTQLRQGPTP